MLSQARGSTISALALSVDGTKLYVGLSDGQLEEQRIVAAPSGAYLSLTARKHISKKVGCRTMNPAVFTTCITKQFAASTGSCFRAYHMCDLNTCSSRNHS